MEYFFMIAIMICGFLDFKTRKIPNKITIPLILFCMLYQITQRQMLFSLIGLGTGFAIGVICYAMNGMGGGDLKLMTAMGAYLGTFPFLIVLFIASILSVIWGFTIYIRRKEFIKEINKVFIQYSLTFLNAFKLRKYFEYDDTKTRLRETIPFGTCLSLALVYIHFNPISFY
jgi:Flp pilus assembly protein, protease CpaA